MKTLSTRARFAAGVAGTLVLALVTSGLESSTAAAQSYYYSPGPGYWQKPRPQKRVRAVRKVPRSEKETAAAKPSEAEPVKKAAGPLVLVVSIKRQRVDVYDQNGLLSEAPISSGRVGYPTPTGVFTILGKEKMHYSNLYGSAPMPNMQRLTWSGVALHAGDLPGYPASHGCIRLPRGFAQKLYDLTKVGNRVIVTRDDVEPVAITHPKLFSALPPDATLTTGSTQAAGPQVADASGATVLGVTAAAAAESSAAPGHAKSSPYREAWKAEMARRVEAVRTAEVTKSENAARVGETAKAVEQAKSELKAAKTEADRLAVAAKKAQDAKQDADRKLASFATQQVSVARDLSRDPAKELPADKLQKIAESEDSLEKATFDLADAAKTAQEDAQQAADDLKKFEGALSEAEAKHASAVTEAKKSIADLAKAIADNEAAKRREASRQLPVSVFVSRKEKKLFVRQGYEQILDMPVTFDAAEQPIGTHVFTALAVKNNQTDVDWSVVSMSSAAAPVEDVEKPVRRGKNAKDEAPAAHLVPNTAATQSAAAALDRITIPDDVRAQIEDVMKPGSSLIISDQGISNETGKFTDFIVLTSGSGGSGGSKKSSTRRTPALQYRPAAPKPSLFQW